MNSEKSANQCKLCKGWRSHATWSATAMRPSVSLTVNTVSTLWPCGLCLKLICQSGYWENSLEALWHKQHPKCSTYGRGWGLFFSQSITKTGIDTEWMQSEKEFFFIWAEAPELRTCWKCRGSQIRTPGSSLGGEHRKFLFWGHLDIKERIL